MSEIQTAQTAKRRTRVPAGLLILFALAMCGVLCVAVTARAVDAQQVRQLLRVRPGATCLSGERLARQVEQRIPNEDIPTDIIIVVEGSATDPRRAVLNVLRAGQTLAHRAFEPGPARCDYLHAAVGLALALSLKTLPPDPPQAPARGWSLSTAGIGTYRVLPDVAPGLDLAAHWAPVPNVALRIGALGNAAFDTGLKRDIGRVDATLIASRSDVCLRLTLIDHLHARACAGVLGGALYIRGTDFATSRSSVVPWIALANAMGLELDLSTHWSLTLDVSVAFLLHEVRIRIEDKSGAEVDGQSLARAGFALGIGPMYNF